jgi:hypothetical protein
LPRSDYPTLEKNKLPGRWGAQRTRGRERQRGEDEREGEKQIQISQPVAETTEYGDMDE